MSSAWESLLSATAILASAAPIKQRLVQAFNCHLAEIDETELPREVKDDFLQLSSSLCSVRPLRGESAVQATVRKMSDVEAGDCATRIVAMLGTLSRHYAQPRQPLLRAVNAKED